MKMFELISRDVVEENIFLRTQLRQVMSELEESRSREKELILELKRALEKKLVSRSPIEPPPSVL